MVTRLRDAISRFVSEYATAFRDYGLSPPASPAHRDFHARINRVFNRSRIVFHLINQADGPSTAIRRRHKSGRCRPKSTIKWPRAENAELREN